MVLECRPYAHEDGEEGDRPLRELHDTAIADAQVCIPAEEVRCSRRSQTRRHRWCLLCHQAMRLGRDEREETYRGW